MESVVGDLRTGAGIAAAVAEVDAIVHCASARTGDGEATRNLVSAAARAGRPHLVYISIVGVDRVSMGYYKSKIDAERAVIDAGLPWTILRATQFYDLILSGARVLARLPVVPVPAGFRTRPVDADEVARSLVELAQGEPQGRVPDLAGPQELGFDEVIRTYLRTRHRRRPVVAVRLPGLGAVRAGGLLPVGEHMVGDRTWEQFLTGS